jgi:hypothetical protein
MLATYPFPRDHASKASATISRFVFTRADLLGRCAPTSHDPTVDAFAILARPHRVRARPDHGEDDAAVVAEALVGATVRG